MERAAVLVDDSELHRELLREAAEYATGSDADLLLARFIDEETYGEELDALEAVGEIENVTYTSEDVTDAATEDIRRLADEVFGDLDVEYDVAVSVVGEDERADRLIETGAQHDCDHAFIVGKSRSPAGKALFGDFAQRVVLNFDGYVTVNLQ